MQCLIKGLKGSQKNSKFNTDFFKKKFLLENQNRVFLKIMNLHLKSTVNIIINGEMPGAFTLKTKT